MTPFACPGLVSDKILLLLASFFYLQYYHSIVLHVGPGHYISAFNDTIDYMFFFFKYIYTEHHMMKTASTKNSNFWCLFQCFQYYHKIGVHSMNIILFVFMSFIFKNLATSNIRYIFSFEQDIFLPFFSLILMQPKRAEILFAKLCKVSSLKISREFYNVILLCFSFYCEDRETV